jgi:DNA-binding NtrC family response regulator
VFPIRLPPLRERSGDVLLLAEHFLKMLNSQENTHKRLSQGAVELLMQRSWPGNIRELKNTMQRAFILAEDSILPEHFPPVRMEQDAGEGKLRFSVGTPIEEAERRLILTTLEHFHGNKPLTAQTLGVSLKTLYNRLKQYRTTDTD